MSTTFCGIIVVGGIILVSGVGCTAPAPLTLDDTHAPTALRRTINDSIGDSAHSTIAVAPDLASATVVVGNGEITFDIQFVPGTMDPSTTWVRIELDADQNSETGRRQPNGMGSDYALLIVNDRASVQQYGYTAGPVCKSCVGSAAVAVTADRMRISVPLWLLGPDEDGRMFFQVRSWTFVGDSPVGLDSLPDERNIEQAAH
jgi:hypothetical protein